MLGRGLSHGTLIAANSGKEKVNWEPRPMSEHQIVWTIPGYCRTGGIIGVGYFSQMRWPVGFLIFSQLPNHAHNHLVWSFYQAISLWVVGHGLQSFDAKDLLHFLNHTTSKASTPITQGPGWGPKDGYVIYRWANVLKNRTIFLLKDKLSPDFCHGFFWSEENVDLNYFPTHGGVWVLVCPWNFLGQMLILIDFWQMLCHILYFLSWQMLLPRLVADLIANFWADVIVLVFWGGDIPLFGRYWANIVWWCLGWS